MTAIVTAPKLPYSKRYSPTGLEMALGCEYAWGLRFIEGLDAPEVTWSKKIEALVYYHAIQLWGPKALGPTGVLFPKTKHRYITGKQRTLALGKGVHAELERYALGGDIDVGTFPGQCALPVLRYVPNLEECDLVLPELSYTYQGIPGTTDLVTLRRKRWRVTDYKSCRDFEIMTRERDVIQCQKPEAELRANFQTARYTIPIMREYDLDTIEVSFIYTRTDPKLRREARATAFLQRREDSERTFEKMQAAKRRLKQYTSLADCEKNTDHCDRFGGCQYHVSRGGPCSPPRDVSKVRSFKQ